MSGPLSTAAWQRLRAYILATHPPICHLCGKPIDLTLDGRHPQGPTVDHIQPRHQGGPTLDPTNLKPAHKHCNSARQDHPITPTTSRDW